MLRLSLPCKTQHHLGLSTGDRALVGFQQLGSTALFKLPQSSEYAGRALRKMNSSEAKLRSERDSQIMKRSVVQVDFIACLQSQSDWSPETLKTGTGIHSEVRPRTSNSGNSVAEIAQSHRR